MGEEYSDQTKKSQLVLEICSLSNLSVSCVHSHRPWGGDAAKSHFIDWYRILGVKENADMEVIKRRYHKLALQLHPDKNKHPKAEIAFKLVLEAYSCLSDNVKRRAFALERSNYFCIKCNTIPYTLGNSLNISCAPKPEETKNPANRSRSYRNRQSIKEIRQRFKEEVKVMENCLKANSTSRKETPVFKPPAHYQFRFQSNACLRSPKESPIFDPSQYLFKGYPHVRNQVYRKPENFWFLQREDISRCGQGKGRCDLPVFENRADGGMFRSKSACVYS